MSSINSNGPIYLNDLGSFAFNGELRKACKAGSGSLQIIVGEKKYEIEVQKGSFFGIGRPRITSMKLIPNTSTQLLTGNSTQSVSFDKFKAIKLGCICGKEDLEKAIKQSQAAKIKEEAGNLAGLLKKSGEDFQKINSALEKIPEALLPDVLRHGMGNKQTLLHAAAESPNGAAFFEAVVKQLNNETELKALLAMKNGKDNTGNTPLHFAAQCGNVDFLNAVAGKLEKDQLKDLLAMGNENNNTGNTPLHLAVGTPNGAAFFKAVAEQLKNETDLKAFLGMGDNDNNTPLHVAAIKAGPNGAAFFDAVAEQLKDKTDLKA
ncbi:MAG: ankyrin repeat domain-containing protein, partial [Puniceicoccales bacterium]|nr:ankyrin repeat domain-containing protein [Puniceicoccales bacterium]